MGKKAPPAPDYTGAANAQAAASKDITNQQTWANRPELNTPWGSQTWSPSEAIDPATGQKVTKWASNISLSGDQQAALDSQMAVQTGRSQAAEQMLGRATDALGQPLNYDGISQGADRIGAPAADSRDWRGMAQEAALGFNKPLQTERRAALEGQLANMGLSRGSAAWEREMRSNSDQETRDNLQVFDTARKEAQLMGDQSVQRQSMDVQAGGFNQQLRQQEIAEMLAQRGQPLNELNALLTGQQVQTPQMPTFSTAGKSDTPQLLGAAQSQYSAALDKTNASNAAFGNLMGGAASLGGAAMGAGGWGSLFSL